MDDVFAWNKWREKLSEDVIIDLSDVDFVTKGQKVDWSGANLFRASLKWVRLDSELLQLFFGTDDDVCSS
ncbi:hypothetical protein KDI_52180 [Dictyobacter arantiisoli]|uniref:Uncharacterized protein n=1 Tax=Dictyobacter arantiisoli TaxID=2014874 RepID=A0A5A5TL32_9CHLR|nr:hypothetical protein KDI_52180 [Dictyobacter arantiisoli]